MVLSVHRVDLYRSPMSAFLFGFVRCLSARESAGGHAARQADALPDRDPGTAAAVDREPWTASVYRHGWLNRSQDDRSLLA